MIQNFLYKTSKIIPILTKRANTLSINNSLKFAINNNIFKLSQASFAEKNEKVKPEKKDAKENKNKDQKKSQNSSAAASTANNEKEKTDISKNNKNKSQKQNNLAEKKEEQMDLSTIKLNEKELEEDTELTADQKETVRKLYEAFTEKDIAAGEEKFINALVHQGQKVLGMKEAFEVQEPKDFESTVVSHNYEKEFGVVSKQEKDFIEKITKDFLRDFGIDAKEAEFLRERRPDILSYALFDRLRDLKTAEDVHNYISDYTDYKNFEFTLERFDNLTQIYRESRDMENPAYVHLRSIDKLLKNEEIKVPKERSVDVRQNALSNDYLKIQPRMKVDYAYNFEQNKEFKHTFDSIVQADQKRLNEKMKLVKYIKSNPLKYGVRNRWLAKHFNVPIEKLPDYEVDIAGFKPEPTKKSRRKYQKRMADDISNYEAWRAFDRVPTFYSADDHHYNVELIPNNLYDVN